MAAIKRFHPRAPSDPSVSRPYLLGSLFFLFFRRAVCDTRILICIYIYTLIQPRKQQRKRGRVIWVLSFPSSFSSPAFLASLSPHICFTRTRTPNLFTNVFVHSEWDISYTNVHVNIRILTTRKEKANESNEEQDRKGEVEIEKERERWVYNTHELYRVSYLYTYELQRLDWQVLINIRFLKYLPTVLLYSATSCSSPFFGVRHCHLPSSSFTIRFLSDPAIAATRFVRSAKARYSICIFKLKSLCTWPCTNATRFLPRSLSRFAITINITTANQLSNAFCRPF